MTEFHTASRVVSGAHVSYTAEAMLVQDRAGRGEPSVIRLGPIVFFSATGGDAWMLDVNDGKAACLARDAMPQPIPIHESDTRFAVRHQLIDAELAGKSEENIAMLRLKLGPVA